MEYHACNCIGPQNGEPLCPCMMGNVMKRDGRWVQKERDLGPVQPAPIPFTPVNYGCVCPPGAEATCKGALCPRQKWEIK